VEPLVVLDFATNSQDPEIAEDAPDELLLLLAEASAAAADGE
jgi:hypothetical protein